MDSNIFLHDRSINICRKYKLRTPKWITYQERKVLGRLHLQHLQRWYSCFSPSGPRFKSHHSRKFILMLLRFINDNGQRKVNRGLIILVEPIQYQISYLLAQQYYDKIALHYYKCLKDEPLKLKTFWTLLLLLHQFPSDEFLVVVERCTIGREREREAQTITFIPKDSSV